MPKDKKYPYDGPKSLKDSGKEAKEVVTTRNPGDAKRWAESEMKFSRGKNPADYVEAGKRMKWEAENTQKGYGYQRQIMDEAGDELIRRGVKAGDAQRKRLIDRYKSAPAFKAGGPVKKPVSAKAAAPKRLVLKKKGK
jgi:hypothetical protein